MKKATRRKRAKAERDANSRVLLTRAAAPVYTKARVATDIRYIREDIASILATESHTTAEVATIETLLIALAQAEHILLGIESRYRLRSTYIPS